MAGHIPFPYRQVIHSLLIQLRPVCVSALTILQKSTLHGFEQRLIALCVCVSLKLCFQSVQKCLYRQPWSFHSPSKQDVSCSLST